MEKATSAASKDWGAPGRKDNGLAKPVAILAASSLVLAALLTFLVSLTAGMVVAVVGLGALALWLTSSGARFLKTWEAVPAAESEGRLLNLVKGVASDLSMAPPKVWVVESKEPNAFALWHRGGNLGVTRALLDSFTRTETEAVVAHCLVRLRDDKGAPTYRAALAGLGLNSHGGDLHYVDAKAAAVTRYPPALAAAVEKASERSGAGATLWFLGASPTAPNQAARAEALRDL